MQPQPGTPMSVTRQVLAPSVDLWAGFPDGLVYIDQDQIIRQVNHQCQAITGRSVQDLVDRPVREALPFTLEDGSDWWRVSNPWQGLRIRTGHRERLLWLPDQRQVLTTARYLRSRRGAPTHGVVLSLRDAASRRRAEQANATLISTLSHELRSPLAGIRGFSAMLLRQWDRVSDGDKRALVEAIESDADRVGRLVTDLLDVSRLDAGRLVVRARPVALAPVLQRHVARAQASVGPGRKVICIQDPALEVVVVDPDRLDQILGNLIENAIRHGRGTITLAVASVAGDERNSVEFTVADEGEGIDEQYRAVAFTRFWHQSQDRGSSGLGLCLVRGLAQAHHGMATIETAPGGGALVRVRLPQPASAASFGPLS